MRRAILALLLALVPAIARAQSSVIPLGAAASPIPQLEPASAVNGAGTSTTSITIPAAASFSWTGRAIWTSPADGQALLTNAAATAGAGLDAATNGTLKIRGTAFTAGTGNLDVGAKITSYNNVATAGWGVPAIVAAGRATAQTAANASVATYTVGAADGSFSISANVLVTTATTHTFTVECAYTDEGNTARTLTLPFTLVAGSAIVTSVANANGAVPYLGITMHIRAKAATSITIRTQAAGTYTTVTYNVEGSIRQIS